MKKVLSLLVACAMFVIMTAPVMAEHGSDGYTRSYGIEHEGVDPELNPTYEEIYEDVEDTVNYPTGELVEGLPFTDVFADDWFANAVKWVFEAGIMNGVSDEHFAPEATTTRGMVVTVLGRYYQTFINEDADIVADFATVSDFEDVEVGQWYAPFVAWAAANGVVYGISETEFAPSRTVNRAELTTILFRFMNSMGLTVELDEEVPALLDADEIPEWASEAMEFMAAAGILFMDDANYARPTEPAPRSEIASAIYFFNMHTVSAE